MAIAVIALVTFVVIPGQQAEAYDRAVAALECGDVHTAQSEVEKAGSIEGIDDLKNKIETASEHVGVMEEYLECPASEIPWTELSSAVEVVGQLCPNYPELEKLKNYAEAGASDNYYAAYNTFSELGDFQKSEELAKEMNAKVQQTFEEAKAQAETATSTNGQWFTVNDLLEKILGYEPSNDLKTRAANEVAAAEDREKLSKSITKRVWCNYDSGRKYVFGLFFFEDGTGILQLKARNTTLTAGIFVWTVKDGTTIQILGADMALSSDDTRGVELAVEAGSEIAVSTSNETVSDYNLTGSYGAVQVETVSFSPSLVDGVTNTKWTNNKVYTENWDATANNAKALS